MKFTSIASCLALESTEVAIKPHGLLMHAQVSLLRIVRPYYCLTKCT